MEKVSTKCAELLAPCFKASSDVSLPKWNVQLSADVAMRMSVCAVLVCEDSRLTHVLFADENSEAST